MKSPRAWRKKLDRGDTIVEVMISMAVLAVVVAAAYSIATRSFQTSLNAQYRDQAVSLGQQQLELIKEADNNKPSNIRDYIDKGMASPGVAFCIDPATKAWLRLNLSFTTNCVFNQSSLPVTVSITYCADPTKPCPNGQGVNSFKVTISWDSATNVKDQSILYYKPNDSFSGTLFPCTPTTCASTVTNQPAVGVSADQPKINAGSPDTIRWNTTNVVAGSCTASGPAGSGFTSPPVNANANPGTFLTQPLNTVGFNTFTVTCKDNASNSIIGFTKVQVDPLNPIVATGSASSITFNSATLNGTVNPNGLATTYQFNYGTSTTYGSSTTATSAGAGNTNVPASTSIGGLSASTTYHFQLCATNASGPVCGNDQTFLTADNLPPPPPLQVYFCQDINYGGCVGPFSNGNYDWVANYGIPNDWISSMFFGTSTTANVAIYWDISFGGACANLNSNTPSFVDFGWNDSVSSFKIGSGC